METISKELETIIGDVTYTFDVTFYYYPGKYSLDPTEGTDTELDSWELGEIHAYHNDGSEWIVKDDSEAEMVEDWTNFEVEFEKAF